MPDYPMGIQYDEQGRPFSYVGGTSRRSYISPVAFGGQAPEDTTGIFRQGPQWNNNTGNWETPIDWGNIMSMGVAGGLGAGALSAAGAFGGGAAAGGGLSEAAIPSAAGLPGGAAGLPGASMVGALPSATVAPTAGALPSGAAGMASGGGMPSWLGPALSAGLGLGGRVLGGGTGSNQIPIPPELTQLLQEATRRSMNQSGLSDAITAQALAGLPRR